MIVVNIPYGEYVMSTEDAFALAKIFEKIERYRDKYHGGNTPSTIHVFPNESKLSMHVISDDLYRMAKLAGKPED